MNTKFLCQACKNFNSDGIDGNHPFCTKQFPFKENYTAIPLNKKCPYGFEFGIPSGYPVNFERNKEIALEIAEILKINE